MQKNVLYTDKWHVIYWSEAVICVQPYLKTTCKHNEHILVICNTDYLLVIKVINWIKSSGLLLLRKDHVWTYRQFMRQNPLFVTRNLWLWDLMGIFRLDFLALGRQFTAERKGECMTTWNAL